MTAAPATYPDLTREQVAERASRLPEEEAREMLVDLLMEELERERRFANIKARSDAITADYEEKRKHAEEEYAEKRKQLDEARVAREARSRAWDRWSRVGLRVFAVLGCAYGLVVVWWGSELLRRAALEPTEYLQAQRTAEAFLCLMASPVTPVIVLVMQIVAVWSERRLRRLAGPSAPAPSATKIAFPPGLVLRRVAVLTCSPATVERVFEPIFADVWAEHAAALEANERWRARSAHIRCAYRCAQAAWALLETSPLGKAIRTLVESWLKGAKCGGD